MSRRTALDRLEGLARQVEIHLDKLEGRRNALARPYWRAELRGWLAEMWAVLPHVGRRTGNQWTDQIAAWESRLASEIDE